MSWSLRLSGGDLVHGGAHYDVVKGRKKLAQDLRCALLTQLGSDPVHPEYGTVIEGGRGLDGAEYRGVVGGRDWEQAALLVDSEIRRVVREYQSYQMTRLREDQAVYGRSTLDSDEVLATIEDIRFAQVGDQLVVDVAVQTQAGNQQTVEVVTGGRLF